MKFTHSIDRFGVTIAFSAKPNEAIRRALKANGFRWQPAAAHWFRGRVSGAADFLTALEKLIEPGKPDGDCWTCKDPNGFFRPYGASTPVYCDTCYANDRQHRDEQYNQGRDPRDPCGDEAYEDRCRDACGL